LTWSARNSFSIVSRIGNSSAPFAFFLAFAWIKSITLPKIAHSPGSRLPGVRC
jgi:hypothetical protein